MPAKLLYKNIVIDGVLIAYYQSEAFDPGNALVFLHGWGSQASHFKNITEHCQNVIAIDLPGFGQSSLPQDVWGIDDYAASIDKFLIKIGINNPVLIGHSFGGSIAIAYASAGKKLKKLILIDAAGIRKPSIKKSLYRMLARAVHPLLNIPGIRRFKDSIRNKAYHAIDASDYIYAGPRSEIYKKIISQDLSPILSKISYDTILIWGEMDKATPLEDARSMQRSIVGSKLYIIARAGHFPFIDQPDDFLHIFLKQIQ